MDGNQLFFRPTRSDVCRVYGLVKFIIRILRPPRRKKKRQNRPQFFQGEGKKRRQNESADLTAGVGQSQRQRAFPVKAAPDDVETGGVAEAERHAQDDAVRDVQEHQGFGVGGGDGAGGGDDAGNEENESRRRAFVQDHGDDRGDGVRESALVNGTELKKKIGLLEPAEGRL